VFLSVPPAVAKREHRGTRDTTPDRCSYSPTSSCRRCTSALAADARLEERDSPHRGPLTQGPRSAGEGADSVVRGDDAEALRLPLVGEVRGPEGPITWLPTLNRGREGLQSQGLMRVVTDTPVTTRAVARATRESGGEALSSGLPHRPRVTLRRVSRGGSREVRRTAAGLDGPTGRVFPGRRSSRRPVAPWELRWRPTHARSGSSRDVRSLLRQAARRQAITRPGLWCCFRAPCLAQGLSFNAHIERDARVSQPGDPRRASHRSTPTAGSRALRKRSQPTTLANALKRGKVGV
jgi:hypothetical protein